MCLEECVPNKVRLEFINELFNYEGTEIYLECYHETIDKV